MTKIRTNEIFKKELKLHCSGVRSVGPYQKFWGGMKLVY